MPRAHSNPYQCHTSGSLSVQTLNYKRVLAPVQSKLDKLKDRLWLRIEEGLGDLMQESDNSVYTGYTGIALLYYTIGIKNGNNVLLQKAEKICDVAIKRLKNKRVSFLNGDSGPLALGAVVYHANGKKDKSYELIRRLIDMSKQVFYEVLLPDEILYGRAGYLYSLLFVNKHIEETPVPQETIRKTVDGIFNSGILKAKQKKEYKVPLMYDWHEKIYLGAAHGFAGILYMLLCARDVLTDVELSEMIRPSIDWLLTYRYQGNNFASSVDSATDRFIQWCHGAPGFINLFLLASKVYKDDRYFSIALESSDTVWRRGLLQKGYSLCHGVAGNAYTFISLYKHTQDDLHRYRLACYLDWCSHYPRDQELRPDRPYSLFEGIAGLLYFLEDSAKPESATFPAYELD